MHLLKVFANPRETSRPRFEVIQQRGISSPPAPLPRWGEGGASARDLVVLVPSRIPPATLLQHAALRPLQVPPFQELGGENRNRNPDWPAGFVR